MSLFDSGPQDKSCFAYCGDERCNCYAAPRYRHLKSPRDLADEAFMAQFYKEISQVSKGRLLPNVRR
jgi:hypothetical protein